MKTILMSVLLLASSFSYAGPCVVPGHTNKQLFNAVLAYLPDNSDAYAIEVKWETAFKATAQVTSKSKKQRALLIEQNCFSGEMHVVGENNNPKNFVCQGEWINCSPSFTPDPEKQKYCSQEYSDWAEANCGGKPMVAQ